MQNIEGAVIAAAGLGSRIGLGKPKCMIEIDGKTLLTRLIETLRPHVPLITVVVGYREDLVIDYCARHHRDVVLVRNPDFRTTNTAYSYALGARHINGKVLYLDGDLVIRPQSLRAFLTAAKAKPLLVGLTSATSENAVFAQCSPASDHPVITGFSRTVTGPFEWANVVAGDADLMRGADGYVFERLVEHLPLDGQMLELAEVDTVADLDAAHAFVAAMETDT